MEKIILKQIPCDVCRRIFYVRDLDVDLVRRHPRLKNAIDLKTSPKRVQSLAEFFRLNCIHMFATYSFRDLIKIPAFGRGTARDIERILYRFGMSLQIYK